MRAISQPEAAVMRKALKEIASFHNDAADPADPGQAAALRARAVLEQLGLFYESADAAGP